MKKCTLCHVVLTKEDLIADDEFCLDCLDSVSDLWDVSGAMHSVRTPQGEISLSKEPLDKGGQFVTNELLFDFDTEIPTHRKEEKFLTSREAVDHYLTLLRRMV